MDLPYHIIEQRGGLPLAGAPEDPPIADGFYWSRDFASDRCWGPFETLGEAIEAAHANRLRGDGYGGPATVPADGGAL